MRETVARRSARPDEGRHRPMGRAQPRCHHGLAMLSLFAMILAACATPQSIRQPAPSGPGGAPEPQRAGAPKRITLAAMMDPPSLISKFDTVLPGAADVEVMVAAGLAIPDEVGVLAPVLAEAVPTIENGLWALSPDGRMETTWKLKRNLRWHDGAPFTAEDLVFTGKVGRDPEMVPFRHPGLSLVDRIEAIDPHTLVVRWQEPYVAADTLFSSTIDVSRITFPLPKHLLEDAYLGDKQAFTQLPYWNDEFVGTGPFRVREWVRGSHALLEAYESFALGRPRVDQVEVRFIADGNTLVANVLAGAADASIGRGLSLDQTTEAERQWRDGKMLTGGPGAWFGIFPQFVNPDPAIIANVTFRRALMHAMDRQQMADTLMYGLVPVAHVFMGPLTPEYKEIEPHIVRYDYNPRRAAELLGGLGVAAGPDGALRDPEGRELSVEIRTSPADLFVKATEVVADHWRRAGLRVQTLTIPQTQLRNLEYRTVRPGFEFSRRGIGMENLSMFHTRELPLPENRYVGKNLARYSNPEMDSLVDRYFASVLPRQRVQVQGQIMRHMSDQLNILTLFYDTEASLVSNRLVNVNAKPAESTGAWNAHLWDVR